MKKFIALTLALLLLAGCAPAYDGPTESAWVVTETRTTNYSYDPDESWVTVDTDTYDHYGNLIRSSYYRDGKLETEYKYTYDDRGNCIREVVLERFWILSLPSVRVEYTYDDQNRLLSAVYRDGFGATIDEETYTWEDDDALSTEFDDQGRIIREVSGDCETVYEYGEAGSTATSSEYRDGVLASTTVIRFDDQFRILELTTCSGEGEVLDRITSIYEENTCTTWDKMGSKSVEIYRPDGLVETYEIYAPAGELLSRTEYTYTQIQIPAEEE